MAFVVVFLDLNDRPVARITGDDNGEIAQFWASNVLERLRDKGRTFDATVKARKKRTPRRWPKIDETVDRVIKLADRKKSPH